MKVLEFEGNTPHCNYSYFRVREGPNYFVSYYKNSSRLHYDPKDTWRTLGVAKFTDTGKALKEWCLSMDEQYGEKVVEEEGRVDTSFASEVLSDANTEAMEEESPTDNTKMIT